MKIWGKTMDGERIEVAGAECRALIKPFSGVLEQPTSPLQHVFLVGEILGATTTPPGR
jgi:hypothetical protein